LDRVVNSVAAVVVKVTVAVLVAAKVTVGVVLVVYPVAVDGGSDLASVVVKAWAYPVVEL
jgi:hypothetical protein